MKVVSDLGWISIKKLKLLSDPGWISIKKPKLLSDPGWISIKKLKLLSDLGGFLSKSSNYSQTQVDFHQKAQITLRPRWISIKKLKLLSDLGGFLSKSRKCGRRIIGSGFFYKKAIRNGGKSLQKFEMFRFFLLVGGKGANLPAHNECRTS
ncbi:hypothetical protein BSK20_01340 [SR1 bacterium human oral taxon HOT-345]|nr:hypothetical protein BSK20_01340 [SR1 bacterium human oral taxon HOT-345]